MIPAAMPRFPFPGPSAALALVLTLAGTTASAQTTKQELIQLSQQLATEWGQVYQLSINCHQAEPALEPTNAVGFFGRYLPPEDTKLVLDAFAKGSTPLRGVSCSTLDLDNGMAGFKRDASSYQVFAAPFRH